MGLCPNPVPRGWLRLPLNLVNTSACWQKWWASFPIFPPFSVPPTQKCVFLTPTPVAEPICQHFEIMYIFLPSLLSFFPPFFPLFSFWGFKTNWKTTHQTDIYQLFSLLCCRCNRLGADDVWDQTIRWDSSQWNSQDPGERGASASAANLYHRCVHDHGEM